MPTGYSNETGKNPFAGKKRPPFSEEHRKRISASSLGRIPWNRGKKGEGKHSEKTKRLMSIQRQDELHPGWKGDSVGYAALHRWISRKLGKAKSQACSLCESKGTLQWSNKDGKYSRDLAMWWPLCAKCHYHYDENELGVVHGRKRGG